MTQHPDDVWINLILALVLQMLNRPEEALRYDTAARALRPDSATHLAMLLHQLGRNDEAERIYRDLMRRMPDNPQHLQYYGQFLLDRGRAAEAKPVLDRAFAAMRAEIARRPTSSDLRLDLIRVMTRSGRHDEAIAEYREAIRGLPEDYGLRLNFAFDLRDREVSTRRSPSSARRPG